MPRQDIVYFGAGPAGLPTAVLGKAAAALLNYNDRGIGVAEISHRSPEAKGIVESLKADLKTYLDIPSEYEVLLMQGGGSGQFAATVQNMVGAWVSRRQQRIAKEVGEGDQLARLQKAVKEELKIDYIVTGSWSLKASKEAARMIGEKYVNIVADARNINKKFGTIPDQKDWKLSKDAAMVYYCDNETVDGVEFPEFPEILKSDGVNGPVVVADMSSNILSRRIPIKNYSAIFFGAQKNLGSAGLTVVVIKKSLLGDYEAAKPKESPTPDVLRACGLGGAIGPTILSYHTTAVNKSLYNTLSIFDTYVSSEVVKAALLARPNLLVYGQEQESAQKAVALYRALDDYPDVYEVVPDILCRSRMNICFRVLLKPKNGSWDKKFIEEAEQIGLFGLAGHRSVGGIRASNYNSIRPEGALRLVTFIRQFAVVHGPHQTPVNPQPISDNVPSIPNTLPSELRELKNFADSFKLDAPVKPDIIPLLTRDQTKQKELQEKTN